MKQQISLWLKEKVLAHYLIPFSRVGVDGSLLRWIRPDQPINLVDAGASEGSFTSSIEKYCGVKHGLLIEPLPDRFRELQRRFLPPQFDVINCALSAENHRSEMNVLNWDFSSSLLKVIPQVGAVGDLVDLRTKERIAVDVRTLDTALEQIGWSGPIDLLKLDLQGAELLALNGTLQSLNLVRLIWTEVSFRPLYDGSATFDAVFEFLVERGYALAGLQEGLRGKSGELLQADALFCRSTALST